MNHSVPTELLSRILNYLATKAYSEVGALIAEVQAKAVQLNAEASSPTQPTNNLPV